jgi:hypothetical protein
MNPQIPIFAFSETIQKGIEAGQYLIMKSKDGTAHSIAYEKLTGRIVGHAQKVMLSGEVLNPLSVLPKLDLIGQSVSLLQTTSLINCAGTLVNTGIAAASLYHTLKLREDVKVMRSEMKDGFLDLKTVLKDQGQEIIAHIDLVAETVEFSQHRTILSRAYAQFSQGTQRLQTALTIQESTRRDAEIQSARNMMAEALKDYENPDLMQNINAAGYIRRRECVWAIRQAIAYSFQLQGEHATSYHDLETLETLIRQDSRQAVSLVNSELELDFLFPEIVHIHTHDLTALNRWQSQLSWLQELPAAEVQQLSAAGLTPLALPESQLGELIEVPLAQTQYDSFKAKSRYAALKDQLRLFVEPDLRKEYAVIINQQAQTQKLQALTPENLSQASDFTIANLYNYFQPKELVTV